MSELPAHFQPWNDDPEDPHTITIHAQHPNGGTLRGTITLTARCLCNAWNDYECSCNESGTWYYTHDEEHNP